MLIRTCKYLLVIIFFSSLSGCAHYAEKRRTEYLRSYAVAPLQVPPGYDHSNISSTYVIPPVPACAPTLPVSILPPGCPGAR